MNAPVAGSKDSTPYREHLKVIAGKNALAARELEPPSFPDSIAYLWDWASELHGRSGIGQYDVHPLTYTTIAAWVKLTGRDPRPHEVEALLNVDAAMFNSAPEKADG